jgi:hypothetical protein
MRIPAELKRRNVIRMAGLHLDGAWLVVQVASTVFPAYEFPSWALRAVILLAKMLALRALTQQGDRYASQLVAMNFLSELQRRNVIRMAGLYLVGADHTMTLHCSAERKKPLFLLLAAPLPRYFY